MKKSKLQIIDGSIALVGQQWELFDDGEEEGQQRCDRCLAPIVDGGAKYQVADGDVCEACYEEYSPCNSCFETVRTRNLSSGTCMECAEEEI